MEDVISTAMSKLSVEDRNHANNELLGVVEHTVSETPQQLDNLLEEMGKWIKKLTAGEAPGTEAFKLADLQDHEFTWNSKFRLKFLRVEQYDPKAAAQRLLRYFEFKLLSFGFEKLTSTITFSDLEEETIAILKSGAYQIMPFTDICKRPILVVYPARLEFHSMACLNQARFYMLSAMAESEEVQRQGLIGIQYFEPTQTRRQLDSEFVFALPFRGAAMHMCKVGDNSIVPAYLIKWLVTAMGSFNVRIAQFRLHSGTLSQLD